MTFSKIQFDCEEIILKSLLPILPLIPSSVKYRDFVAISMAKNTNRFLNILKR